MSKIKKRNYKKINLFINIWIILFCILFIGFAIYFSINKGKNNSTIETEINSEETVKFKLNGEKEITIYIGDEYDEPGFIAESNISGDISSYVEIEGDVDTEIPGVYKINYILNYKTINPKHTRTITVTDNKDSIISNEKTDNITETTGTNQTSSKKNENIALYLNGNSSMYILKGTPYTDPGAKAINKNGKDVSSLIKSTGNVNSNQTGTYTIKYTVNDSKGRSITLTRTVNVVNISAQVTSNIKSYTNQNITLNISVNADIFSHIILPNGQKVTTNNYNYTVSENGNYSFEVYNKVGLGRRYTYKVKNIDKIAPTATCEIVQNTNEAYIKIASNDNLSGVKKYVYNNKSYTTNKINPKEFAASSTITIYDKANNTKQINCINKNPIITNISEDGVIINISAKKATSEITGYYFSYTNKIPNKNTGGYLATNKENFDVVRLPGTTYIWVEDANGRISQYRSIEISNDVLLLTRSNQYKKLENISLESFLSKNGWSKTELDKLIIRSVRAAGLYTQEAAATAGVALQTVLAQKYRIKLPYWWGGKSWDIGADKSWGIYKTKYSDEYDTTYYYYGLDCSGFTTWAYVNAGYQIKPGQYPGYWGSSKQLTKDNGEIGDFLVQKGHTTLIVGKTNKGYIVAEAAGKGPGMVLTLHPYTKTSGYYITDGIELMNKYPKINKNSYPSGF